MSPRTKKPKCATANKTCGMACKPKAAICADQRKKLVANSKKAGLKGQAAKDYVQARIDRYKALVGNKGKLGEAAPTATSGRSAKVETANKMTVQDYAKKVANLIGGKVWYGTNQTRVYLKGGKHGYYIIGRNGLLATNTKNAHSEYSTLREAGLIEWSV